MPYGLLADAVLILHAAFILFVVVGGWIALRYPWVAVLHLPAAIWGAYVQFTGHICPLTPLENHLLHLAGEQGYSGGFIEHYLVSAIYPDGLTPAIQLALGCFVAISTTLAYALLHWRLHRKGIARRAAIPQQ